MPEEVLTPKEIAEKLKVTVRMVQYWIAQGKLKSFQLGRVTRITLSDFQAFLHEHQTGQR